MSDLTEPNFISEPDPDNPGWNSWIMIGPDCYNGFLGNMLVRRGEKDIARVRMTPEKRHSNLDGHVHGGAMTGFIDCALFASMRVLERGTAGPAVTLELQTHFLGAARPEEPLEAQVEVTRETGRFLFMRGLVVQGVDEKNMASFTAIVKKAPKAK